jgi:hypothetical protein
MEYLNWVGEHWLLTLVLVHIVVYGAGNTIIYTARALRGWHAGREE